jgi:hypothetical protein
LKRKKEILSELSKSLFWDVELSSLDPAKHATYIIERVLTRGSWEEFKKIIAYYGKEKVAAVATKLRYMDKIVLAFCVTYFNMPKKKFRCYAQRQLHPTYWNY